MAGDLNITEYVLIASPGTRAAAAPGAPAPEFVHRYGDRVLIGQTTESAPPSTRGGMRVAAAAEELEDAATGDLTPVEEAGLQAFRLRLSSDYIAAKARRPRDREEWDMPGCAEPPPPEARGALAEGEAGAPGPTSAYLEGSVAVGIVIVEGPTAALKFSAAERTKVVAEVQNGLSWLASMNPSAGISFVYDIRVVTLTVNPNPSAADREALWRDPAVAALGFAASWAGVSAYVESLRTNFQTRWTYCGFFTKYPVNHFAYASIGGPRIVMDYNNDGWGPDNIDRVFAHETGHIFGCPDEYASSGCNCGGTWGRFGQPNTNCANCAPGGGVACLMKGNDWVMCDVTPAHLGWSSPLPAVAAWD